MTCSGCVCSGSWDDSSSVSSGISDTIDNLSTDDINTSSSISSYANTPASSRKNLDAGKERGPSCGPCQWRALSLWVRQEPFRVGRVPRSVRGGPASPAHCLRSCLLIVSSPAGRGGGRWVLGTGVGGTHCLMAVALAKITFLPRNSVSSSM